MILETRSGWRQPHGGVPLLIPGIPFVKNHTTRWTGQALFSTSLGHRFGRFEPAGMKFYVEAGHVRRARNLPWNSSASHCSVPKRNCLRTDTRSVGIKTNENATNVWYSVRGLFSMNACLWPLSRCWPINIFLRRGNRITITPHKRAQVVCEDVRGKLKRIFNDPVFLFSCTPCTRIYFSIPLFLNDLFLYTPA